MKYLQAKIIQIVLIVEMGTVEELPYFAKNNVLYRHSGYLSGFELFSYQIDTLFFFPPKATFSDFTLVFLLIHSL